MDRWDAKHGYGRGKWSERCGRWVAGLWIWECGGGGDGNGGDGNGMAVAIHIVPLDRGHGTSELSFPASLSFGDPERINP